MTNGNDWAMPTDIWCESRNGGFYQEGTDPGLTKREYFAAMAAVCFILGVIFSAAILANADDVDALWGLLK